MEFERLYQTLKLSVEEADARMSSHETQLSEMKNQADSQLEKLSTQISLQMQQKTEFSDLETLAHKIHAKADHNKVQELLGELRNEIVSQISVVKKDVKKKAIKKKGEVEINVKEQEFANEKLFEEIRGFKDKLTKLANQFDKELIERDKALK